MYVNIKVRKPKEFENCQVFQVLNFAKQFEEGTGVWSEGKEEAGTTEEDMEIASGEGE